MTELEWMMEQDAQSGDKMFRGVFARVWNERGDERASGDVAREDLIDMDQGAACEYIRARASEAALVEDLKRKDATITALSEALNDAAPRSTVASGPCWCPHYWRPQIESDHVPTCAGYRAALRLAGRLP